MLSKERLCTLLVVLFLAVSFNAYACLIPVPQVNVTQQGSCSDSQEQPMRQFCDAFKTLSVQSADELHLNKYCQTSCLEDTASLSIRFSLSSQGSRLCDHPAAGPPQDLLLKTSVLRI